MPTLSTHVLDTAHGRPAGGIPVRLEDDAGRVLAEGVTDEDGRVGSLGAELAGGTYTLRFQVSAHQPGGFYPEVAVTFTFAGDERHYHVPLLLSPFGYSTYRGS
jgi:5-hydroxyisourate hydrolase